MSGKQVRTTVVPAFILGASSTDPSATVGYFPTADLGFHSVAWSGAAVGGEVDATDEIAAACAAHKNIVIPEGDWLISSAIPLQSGQKIVAPNARLIWGGEGDYEGFFVATDETDISIVGATFVGTGVEAGVTTSAAGDTGAAIRGSGCSRVSVAHCRFEGFVLSGVDLARVSFADSRNISCHNNFFAQSNYNGTDFGFSYRVGELNCYDNTTYSDGDKFLFIATTGSSDTIDEDSLIEKTAHHNVWGNYILLNAGIGASTVGRHGIVVHYQGGRSYLTCWGNTVIGANRHAVYLRGSDSAKLTGPSSIIDNTIRFCCGGSDEYAGITFHGVNCAIKCESSNGAIIRDNVIEDIGYYPDGTVRPHAAAGIGYNRQASAVEIVNNKIRRVNGYGIAIIPTVDPSGIPYSAEAILVENNFIEECVVEDTFSHTPVLIYVYVPNDDVVFQDIRIRGNGLKSSVTNAIMLHYLTRDIGGSTRPNGIIEGNRFYGAGDDQGQTGIGTIGPCEINGNEFFNVQYCIRNRSVGNTIGYIGHRVVGNIIRIERNRATACGKLLAPDHTQDGRLSLVGTSNVYLEGTARPETNFGAAGTVLEGRLAGHDGTNQLFEIIATAAPTAQQYYAGDRVVFPVPSAGGSIGLVCTEAGTPGTWKTFGAVEA